MKQPVDTGKKQAMTCVIIILYTFFTELFLIGCFVTKYCYGNITQVRVTIFTPKVAQINFVKIQGRSKSSNDPKKGYK